MWLNGPTQWNDHYVGKKHIKNLKRHYEGSKKEGHRSGNSKEKEEAVASTENGSPGQRTNVARDGAQQMNPDFENEAESIVQTLAPCTVPEPLTAHQMLPREEYHPQVFVPLLTMPQPWAEQMEYSSDSTWYGQHADRVTATHLATSWYGYCG